MGKIREVRAWADTIGNSDVPGYARYKKLLMEYAELLEATAPVTVALDLKLHAAYRLVQKLAYEWIEGQWLKLDPIQMGIDWGSPLTGELRIDASESQSIYMAQDLSTAEVVSDDELRLRGIEARLAALENAK